MSDEPDKDFEEQWQEALWLEALAKDGEPNERRDERVGSGVEHGVDGLPEENGDAHQGNGHREREKGSAPNSSPSPVNEDDDRLPEPINGLEFRERKTPAPEWMVPGLLLKGIITFFFGPSFSGKTILAIHVIVEAVKAGHRVLFIEEEGTEWELVNQLREAGLKTDEEWERVGFFYGVGPDLANDAWRLHLEAKLHGYDLLVADSWTDVHSVPLLEHAEMNELLKWLRGLIRRNRKTCLSNAHTPKSAELNEGDPKLADLFGAQGQGAKVDGAFVVRDFRTQKRRSLKDEEDETDETEPSSNPLKEVWCVKLRGNQKPGPRVGRVVKVLLPDSKDVGVWRWEGISPAQMRGRETLRKAIEAVHLALAALGPMPSKEELYRRMAPIPGSDVDWKRPSKKRFGIAFDRLLADGRADRDSDTGQVRAL